MSELIDKNKVIKTIESVPYKGSAIHKVVDTIIEKIKFLPSEENKGKWLAQDAHGYTPGGNPIYVCSKCKWIFGSHLTFPNFKFCPMCGSKNIEE